MTRILALSGSLRAGSFNTALAHAAKAHAPDGVMVEVETLHGIPLYDGDVEKAEGIPAAVEALRAKILRHDGLLLVTPEYNNGMPGVFKNGIDWLSRTPSDLFAGRPVALIGASPGGFGTILSQNHWLPVLKTLGTDLWSGGRMMVSRVNTLMDDQGRLADPATLEMLEKFVAGFARFVAARER
ncbi:MAG: NAD(P)H-dependent oxidoreductase [Xanthomonadaceae bacterium]|nr:NAD(P)H-dependent oxidoreductase [Xanthomonadaceae bacterium]